MSKELTLLCADDRTYGAMMNLRTGQFDDPKPMDLALDECDGEYKKCLIGGLIALFRLDGEWFIQVGKFRWPLGLHELHISQSRFGVLQFVNISCGSFSKTFVDTRFQEFAFSKMDPTYDQIDDWMSDFFGRMVFLHERALGAR
ncbi:hypothetical protein IC757_03115 [Wenzhouxiangella sp. AB-CW3]|uniref:hypothetical protein n=1 Tax=Wenzhouxiangella sp. AB-CW3 TaxID=2771012 RepID=UPI00168B52C6|nr:hypothetical protein [Wenzhouxiangella sp. AB-CW3]QOC23165.1 hypothetical protein IC757_03115 [Wenzhouxiangella sp. AB-CW3]